jgi:hypothetical protein
MVVKSKFQMLVWKLQEYLWVEGLTMCTPVEFECASGRKT